MLSASPIKSLSKKKEDGGFKFSKHNKHKNIMYKFIYEHAARTFAYQKGLNGWDAIVTESEGYWWVEVL